MTSGGTLGEFAEYSLEARNRLYKSLGCRPLTTDAADAIPRTQWLRLMHITKPFRRVLDFGCHDGFMHRWLLKEWDVELVFGVEISREAVKHAVLAAAGEVVDGGPIAVYTCESWEDFCQPLRFSEAIASELVEHFTHDECLAMVNKLHTYLLPGGRGFITTPHIDGVFGKGNPDPHHINLMYEHDVEALITAATGAKPVVLVRGEFIYAVWEK